jgi:hypothetical protein
MFFGTAATLFKMRRDWRQAYNSIKKDLQDEIAGLKLTTVKQREAWDRLDTSLTDARIKVGDLTLLLREKEASLKTAEQRSVLSQQSADQASAAQLVVAESLQAKETSYDKLSEQFERASQERATAIDTARAANKQRDSMRLDLAKTQEDLHLSRTEYQNMSEEHDTLQTVLASIKRKYGDDVVVGRDAPRIDAVVKAVEDQLIVLSVGQDQKVQEGFEFTVYRGDQFIGKVKILTVYPDLSGASIIFTKKDARIRAGDRASTQIAQLSKV